MIYWILALAALFVFIVYKSRVYTEDRPLNIVNMRNDYSELIAAIEECQAYDLLGHLEERVDDFYNQYLGHVDSVELRQKCDRLYSDLCAKGIELCAHPTI